MPAVSLDSMKWPSKPHVLWLETRTAQNFPQLVNSGSDAATWGLDDRASAAQDVLFYGEEVPPGGRPIVPSEAVELVTDTRTTVFLQPPTRMSASAWPKLLSRQQCRALPSEENHEGVFWTAEHAELLSRLTQDQWDCLVADHEIDQLSTYEWHKRSDGDGLLYSYSEQQKWSDEEHRAALERIEQRKQDCLKLYLFHQELSTVYEQNTSLATTPFSSSQTVTEWSLWITRATVEALQCGAPLDRNTLTNAAELLQLGQEGMPGFDIEKARPFTTADLPDLATGKLVFSYTPYALLQVWPVLLDKSTSARLCKALFKGVSAPWDFAYNDLLASLPPGRGQQILCAQWTDFCAIYELRRRLAWSDDERLVKAKKAAEERYRQRRRECLVLYELSQLLDLTDKGEKLSVAALKIAPGEAPKSGFFSLSLKDPLLPPLLPPPTPTPSPPSTAEDAPPPFEP
ncbi:hypothetical protein JCM10207_002127 [Rhodosporidiobolus poonsookiae]